MLRGTLRSALAAVALLTLAGCSSSVSAPHLRGTWGGREAALEVGDAGAELSFPCGAGHIDGPIAIDADGRFDVAGTFTTLHGARPRDGASSLAPEPVRYRGRIEGDTLALTVQIQTEQRTYRLTRNAAAEVPLCA